MTHAAPALLDAVARVASAASRLSQAAEAARAAISRMRREAMDVVADVSRAAAEAAALIDADAALLAEQFVAPQSQADARLEADRQIVAAMFADDPTGLAGFTEESRSGYTEPTPDQLAESHRQVLEVERHIRERIARREALEAGVQVIDDDEADLAAGGHGDGPHAPADGQNAEEYQAYVAGYQADAEAAVAAGAPEDPDDEDEEEEDGDEEEARQEVTHAVANSPVAPDESGRRKSRKKAAKKRRR